MTTPPTTTIQMHIDPASTTPSAGVQVYTFIHDGERYVYTLLESWSGDPKDMPERYRELLGERR